MMSMVSTLEHVKKESGDLGFGVKFLYTTRDPGPSRSPAEILFLGRLQSVFQTLGTKEELHLFLTPSKAEGSSVDGFTEAGKMGEIEKVT